MRIQLQKNKLGYYRISLRGRTAWSRNTIGEKQELEGYDRQPIQTIVSLLL